MAGAYVAKPAAAVEVDYPPGWNINWPFPGPYPPGYTPVYSIIITAASITIPGNQDVALSLVLWDHYGSGWATSEPVNNSIVWSATVSGAGSAASAPAGVYSSLGDNFWGESGIYSFTGLGVGDVITITATSEPFDGFPLTQTAAVSVIAPSDDEWKITITTTATLVAIADSPDVGYTEAGASWYSSVENFSGVELVGIGYSLDEKWVIDSEPVTTTVQTEHVRDGVEGAASAAQSSGALSWTRVGSGVASADVSAQSLVFGSGTASSNVSYVLKLYKNDELQETLSGSLEATGDGSVISMDDYLFTFNEDGTYAITQEE